MKTPVQIILFIALLGVFFLLGIGKFLLACLAVLALYALRWLLESFRQYPGATLLGILLGFRL